MKAKRHTFAADKFEVKKIFLNVLHNIPTSGPIIHDILHRKLKTRIFFNYLNEQYAL